MAARFTRKFNELKVTRTIRLTDTAWNRLQQQAAFLKKSRADLIELWAREELILMTQPHQTQALLAQFLAAQPVEVRPLAQRILQEFMQQLYRIPNT